MNINRIEEAIEFGNMWLQINEDCKDSNTYTFFKMAIEALKQESAYYSSCIDCDKKMDEIRRAYDKLKEQDPKIVYAVTYWSNDLDCEPVVTVFSNENAAKKCCLYFKGKGFKTCIDKCLVYSNFTEDK